MNRLALAAMATAMFLGYCNASVADTNSTKECGTVSMAGLSWGSASILGAIDKKILENGYGCTVVVIPGGTVPSFTSIVEHAQPDIMGELWPNAAGIDPYNAAMKEGKIVEAADASPIGGVEEGWYVLPNILKEHPELTTLEAVLARPDLFPHPDDPSKGAFVTCPPGSGCQISNENLFRAFNMDKKGWKMVEPGDYASEDATISKAVDQNEAWFGYYSAPTSLIKKYDMRKLDWGVGFAGPENWACITKPDCPNPKPSAWTESFVRTIYTKEFKDRGLTDVEAYLNKRVIPGDVMNSLLLYMDETQATPDEVAEMFFSKYDIWKDWVSEPAAKNIR